MATSYAKYGITRAQWLKLFELQHGRCPICEKPIHKPRNVEGKRAAAVDHDHKTKAVRGLLHFRCNKYLVGRHTVATAERVYKYLTSGIDARTL